jgi:tetratricopeptide (TPR) repeat protein
VNILRRARGSEIPRKSQRVFLCGTQDRAGYDALTDDILSQDAGIDCVVSWIEPGGAIDGQELRNELIETQLLVLWVTSDMLISARESGFPLAYVLAKEAGTPVLPIVDDESLLPIFTELAGKIHGIAKTDFEYRKKLHEQLETFLASEELVKEIGEKAFTAEIFLSYRKIDIDEARAFMKDLHCVDGLQAVSIWYDNYLTAGKAFDDEIRQAIESSNAFVLLVTPQILEKNAQGETNYVVKEEVPYAIKIQKTIVPIEAQAVDKAAFAILLPAAGEPVPKSMLTDAFQKKLDDAVYIKTLGSERAYFLGRAYLRGYRVERDYDRAVKLFEIAAKEETVSGLKAANQLGSFGYGDFCFEKALSWMQRAANISEKINGENHPDTADPYNEMGNVLNSMGETEKALEKYQKALSLLEKALLDVPAATAKILHNVANIYHIQRVYDKAIEHYQKSLDIKENELEKDHMGIAKTYSNIACVYTDKGDHDKALVLHEKSLNIVENMLGKETPNSALIYNNIACVYFNQKAYDKSLENHEKALEIKKKAFGEKHPDTAVTYFNIANIYLKQGAIEMALGFFRKSYDAYAAHFEPSHQVIKMVGIPIGILETLREQLMLAAMYSEDFPGIAMIYNNIAMMHFNLEIFDKALEWSLLALKATEKVSGKYHQATGAAYNNIAVLYAEMGENRKALAWHMEALTIKERVLGKKHPETAMSYNNIGNVYFNLAEYRKALGWYQKAFEVFFARLGHSHPDTVNTKKNMDRTRGKTFFGRFREKR